MVLLHFVANGAEAVGLDNEFRLAFRARRGAGSIDQRFFPQTDRYCVAMLLPIAASLSQSLAGRKVVLTDNDGRARVPEALQVGTAPPLAMFMTGPVPQLSRFSTTAPFWAPLRSNPHARLALRSAFPALPAGSQRHRNLNARPPECFPGGAWERGTSLSVRVPQNRGPQKTGDSHRLLSTDQLTIIRFTGREAETHYTTNGTLVTTLSVATKESWKNASGDWVSRTEWHRVVFGKLAEQGRTLAKGSHAIVQGAVRTREYEKDGLRHRVFQLRAETTGKLDRAERREASEVPTDIE